MVKTLINPELLSFGETVSPSSLFHAHCANIGVDVKSRTMELKENTSIVVLGASGDLAKKKTVGADILPLTLDTVAVSLHRALR